MPTDLLVQILPQIKGHIYPASLPLTDWKYKEGDLNASASHFNDKSWKTLQIPTSWGEYGKTFWFRRQVVVPPEFTGKPLALVTDFADALLFVNGKPQQGIDDYHREAFLTDKARWNQQFSFAIEAYSGRKRGMNTFRAASLAVLNPTARALYNGLSLLHELEKFLGAASAEAKDIRELIRRTLIFLKYFLPDGEEYPNAIGRAYNFLMKTLDTEFKTDLEGMVHLIPQSHIDVVWLWTLKETAKKCGRTFSTALRLMEEFPEFTFVQSQAQLYQLTKEQYPDLYKQIKQRIAEGRWLPIGSMWVEPDCNIPNAESLIRQILYGKQFFQNEFGITSDVAWLPDTFGYNWALPQILKKSGFNYFFTTKLRWNDTNKFPYSTFWWEGVDGTKILSHVPGTGLEGPVTPKSLKENWEQSQTTDHPSESIHVFGFGDGGGGATKEQLEHALLLKTIVGMPPSKLSSVKEFFSLMEERSEGLPECKNELYLEKHRGSYTSQGWVKRENRACETLLYNAELLASLATLLGKSAAAKRYPSKELDHAWKKLLLNQFHNILSGSAIADAYMDVRKDYDEIRSVCNNILQRSFSSLGSKARKSSKQFTFTLYNTLTWSRNEYVELELKSKGKNFAVTDEGQTAIEHQIIAQKKGLVKILCYVRNIPPVSSKQITVRPTDDPAAAENPWKTSPRYIETPLFRLRFDTKGRLSSMYDKTLRRELLKKGESGNDLQTFKDMPEEWDAWDLDPHYEAKRSDLLKIKEIKILEKGPLRAVLRVEYRTPKGSTVVQDTRLYHQIPRIDFVTNVKWGESQTLLKVAFPVAIKSNVATYEIQSGAIRRSTSTKESVERAKYEVPAQQWADLSDAKFGVSLLNDSKYGYDCRENKLRLTLLRSPFYPHPIEPWRLNDTKVTDQGPHIFSYAIYSHKGDWKKGGTVRRAREFNNPILILPHVVLKEMKSLVRAAGSNIVIDAIKQAEREPALIIRAHEAHGQPTQTTFEFGFPIESVVECNLMEEQDQKVKTARSKVVLRFKPFEIKTLKVVLRTARKR